MPSRRDEIVSWLRAGLASENGDIATSALSCLRSWTTASKTAVSSFYPPPVDLFREVGLVIAARRKEVLTSALGFAKFVFDEAPEEQREAISDYVLQDLIIWLRN